MSSHSEKLLEVEMEIRSLRVLRDELENLRGSLESVRTRLNALEQGGRTGTGSTTHTLGKNMYNGWPSLRDRGISCRGTGAGYQVVAAFAQEVERVIC